MFTLLSFSSAVSGKTMCNNTVMFHPQEDTTGITTAHAATVCVNHRNFMFMKYLNIIRTTTTTHSSKDKCAVVL